MRLLPRSASIPALAAVLTLSGTAAAQDPDYVLICGNVSGNPGDVVTVPILLDNSGGNIQGWSFGLDTSALGVPATQQGATTAAFNGGAGPDFYAVFPQPQGVTAGVVVSFFGTDWLPPGTGHELHLIDIQIPASATFGTVYPLRFVEYIGNPPVEIVVVVAGQGYDPTLIHGTITVGSLNYCGPAVPNSSGGAATIRAEGSFYAGGNPLELISEGMPTNQFGYFLASQTQGLFNPPGSVGFICLGGSIARFNGQIQNTGNTGAFAIAVDTLNIPTSPAAPIAPGETWNFQAWFRDVGSSSNFTDGLSISFQ